MTRSSEALGSTLRSQRRAAGLFVRSTGATAPEALTTPPPELVQLTGREGHPWRWECGEGDRRQRRYRVPPPGDALITLCFVGDTAAARRRSVLHHVGAAVRRLHAVALPDDVAPSTAARGTPATAAPPALRRLHGFLTLPAATGGADAPPGAVTDPVAARRRLLFGSALRPGLEQELREDCRAAMTPTAGVLSHGWLGLDKWFTAAGGGVGLIGEDLGIAAPEHDLGSLLAQIVEYHHLVPGLITAEELRGDARALLEGYGGVVDPAWLDREVRLAVTRHIGDYALHTGGPESELERYAHLLNALPPIGRDRTARR